jgi:MoaA/NifB/PqqE/SkfB family radical SAM enzyme
VPTTVARSTDRFDLDSNNYVGHVECWTAAINGRLLDAGAQELVSAAASSPARASPRDVILELNTNRATRPIFWPGRHFEIIRDPLPPPRLRQLMRELGQWDDLRLTLAGVGDPLLADHLFDTMAAARDAGIRAIHVETDLIGISDQTLRRLAESPIDILSVSLPALSAEMYAQVMGADGLPQAIANIRAFFTHLQALDKSTPILVPTFVKLRANLHEMEPWYDHWLRAVGCAVITGPTDCAGRIPDLAVIDMSPPRRRPCRRLDSRLTILCDGRVVSCEEDVLGAQPLGRVGEQPIDEIWNSAFGPLRAAHASGAWDTCVLCANCRQWHKP